MNTDEELEDAVLARIDELVKVAVEQGQAPGVVAAVARGDSVHVATAGVMAVGGAPMARDTLFRISSNTKPMTAAVVLSLVDAGVLELERQLHLGRGIRDDVVERSLARSHSGGSDPACCRRNRDAGRVP